MTGPTDWQLHGRWRISDSGFWGKDHLDPVAPAEIWFETDSCSEVAGSVVEAGMTLE